MTVLEIATAGTLRPDLTQEKFPVVDGYIHLLESPGLGVTIREETIQKYRIA